MRSNRIQLRLPKPLADELLTYARSRGQTRSKVIRDLLAPLIGPDRSRPYVPDGQHTPEAVAQAVDAHAVARIFANLV